MQQRSVERLERMLDACARLIDEIGYDGVTTTLIAERAGVAVGSLYQFFPDKRAVVQALTQRNLRHFIDAVSERLSTVDPQNWWDAVDTVFDIYLRMHRELPGFRQVHFGDVVDPLLMDGAKENDTVIAESLATALRERFGMPSEQIDLPIAVAVRAGDAVLRLAFRTELNGDPTLVAEAKELVRGYLVSRLGPI
ncbi:MAG: TetR family transcriptional regulator [Sciscionella sp.]